MMRKIQPGHFLLMPNTVMWIESLKIQRKARKNHHGGVGRFKMPSNGVNINNLISVATTGINTEEKMVASITLD